jgi:hypothetical protein
MDPSRRERLTEYYLSDAKALPGKEIKPLINSKLDRFANILEINFDLATNAQVKVIQNYCQLSPYNSHIFFHSYYTAANSYHFRNSHFL